MFSLFPLGPHRHRGRVMRVYYFTRFASAGCGWLSAFGSLEQGLWSFQFYHIPGRIVQVLAQPLMPEPSATTDCQGYDTPLSFPLTSADVIAREPSIPAHFLPRRPFPLPVVSVPMTTGMVNDGGRTEECLFHLQLLFYYIANGGWICILFLSGNTTTPPRPTL